MNAEDCSVHRQYIDVEGPEGILYPWVCPCPRVEGCGAVDASDWDACGDCSDCCGSRS